MMRPFLICGSSFKVKDDQDEFGYSSPSCDQQTSTKSFKISSPCSKTAPKRSKKDSKNPFSNRGLDKFSALLAKVGKKKQEIYLSKDSRNISLVRFVYSSPNDDVVPIVVVKTNKDKKNHAKMLVIQEEEPPSMPTMISAAPQPCLAATTEKIIDHLDTLKKQPFYYVAAFIIFILLLLIVFGRSGAILFTTIGWYVVPSVTGDAIRPKNQHGKKKGGVKKLTETNNMTEAIDGFKKKELVRKFSEIKMVNDHGLASKNDSGHRKSF